MNARQHTATCPRPTAARRLAAGWRPGYSHAARGMVLGLEGRKDAIVAGVLILVIGAAVGTAAVKLRSHGASDYIFECTQCHKQFSVSQDDPQCLASPNGGPAGIVKPCPRCSKDAVWTTRCPACRKNVLLIENRTVCPKCNVNVRKWLEDAIQAAHAEPKPAEKP